MIEALAAKRDGSDTWSRLALLLSHFNLAPFELNILSLRLAATLHGSVAWLCTDKISQNDAITDFKSFAC